MALPTRDDFLSRLNTTDCPICYEPISNPFKTDCHHGFCLDCAKTWFGTSDTCPACRTKMYEKAGDKESSDVEEDQSHSVSSDESSDSDEDDESEGDFADGDLDSNDDDGDGDEVEEAAEGEDEGYSEG